MSDALVIVDAGGANLGSVRAAFARLGIDAPVTTDAARISAADRVVLPGVGNAATVMARLRTLGLVDTLRALRQPLLGICVGMQVLYERSDEGDVEGLGLLPGRVRALAPAPGLRVPHMGWNRVRRCGATPLLDDDGHAYFVHAYAADADAHAVADCEHGTRFAAVVRDGNRHGVQFHPERSGTWGAQLLARFAALPS
ncbi:MAG TPA: imidazole glycerol phosphate synthase subunit HisH [Xanthomonadales bacterium]|nr:imidazole glycerol phosphate synthase subunit HisH [Xanthomonadales bacterium]